MSLEPEAPTGGSEQSPVAVHISGGDGNLTARDAARSIVDWRRKSAAGTDEGKGESAEPPATPEPVKESVEPTDATPPETEAPGETERAEPEAVELSPIEPPRSWTKDEKEEFATYPREAQEKIARREQERDSATRRSQNEAAEKLKGLTAKEQAVEQARQQYESATQTTLQTLQTAVAGEFSDLKSEADVTRMASEDWPRYIRWLDFQRQIGNYQRQVDTAEQQRRIDKQHKLSEFIKREAELFAEKAPEVSDKAQRDKIMSSAVEVLKDIGFPEDELGQLYRGEKEISLHDHRLHLLIRDGIKWRDAQQKVKTAVTKPVPPVQRPGAAQPKGAQRDARIQALTQQVEKSSGVQQLRASAKLLSERRRAGA